MAMEMDTDFMMQQSIQKLQLSDNEGEDNTNNGSSRQSDERIPNVCSSSQSSRGTEIEQTPNIAFHPPAYLQRYAAVCEVLANLLEDPKHKDVANGNTVMEVGCAEYGMAVFLKSILGIGKVIFMDIDETLLKDRKHLIRPLPAEHLARTTRPKPLVFEVFAGCITQVDTKILRESPKVWAIVAIELIEHLIPEVLRGFEISVFGVISPEIIIVTTPNADFNQVFGLSAGQFRHWDHKFEWTRLEFISWCKKICDEFPEYKFTVRGICAGPAETEHLGHVSQMAVFEKVCQNGFHTSRNGPHEYMGVVKDNVYKQIERVEYPNYIEKRTPNQIILEEFLYTIEMYWMSKRNLETCMEQEITELFFPLDVLQRGLNMPAVASDINYLRNLFTSENYDVRVNDQGKYGIRIVIADWEKEDKELELEEEMEDQPSDVQCFSIPASKDDDSWD